jgi:hypothetical protein
MPHTPTPQPLPGESLEELENLAAAWLATFPGDSHLLQTLRAQLLLADCQLRRDQKSLNAFESALATTGAPTYLWPPYHQEHLDRLRRRHSRSQLDFNRALASAGSSYTATLPKPAKPSEPEPKPIPMVAPESSKSRLLQTVLVSVEDGVTITMTEQPAPFWIEKNMWNDCIGFTRQFEFLDTVIPPEYAYVLTHNGEPQPPSRFLNITYSPEEFEKLCRLEVASGSPHLLDGPRLLFQRLH